MNQLVEPKPTLRLGPTRSGAARVAPTAPAPRLSASLRNWWQRLWMDDMTAYLSQAENAVDLEYRIRNWNEHERRDRMPLR
jgi:hypothetical protein